MYRTESGAEKIMPVLHIEGLSKSYRGKNALTNISFSVSSGTLTVILGPAGAGKTTTLRLIAGLEQPDSGDIVLAGRDTAGLEPKVRDVAMIFDNLALYPNKTGYENIASPLVIRKEAKDEIERKVSEIASALKISHILKRLPKTMSGGERQRVALGRALIRSPKLFLLDEPLSSLDAQLRIELRAELKRLQGELGYTFLMATPDFQEAMAVADTIIVLREGKIIQMATPHDIYHNPADRDVARFVGAPQINLLPASVDGSKNDKRLAVAEGLLQIPEHLSFFNESDQGFFELGIRPENLHITSSKNADFHAYITDIEPIGFKSVLAVQAGGKELRMLIDNKEVETLAIGKELGVSVSDSSCLLAFDAGTGGRIF